MEDGSIKDSQITASTSFNIFLGPHWSRLNKGGSWSVAHISIDQWIQVDLGISRIITGIVLQGGDEGTQEWVKSYKVEYSRDGIAWLFVNQYDEMVNMKINASQKESPH